MTPYGAWREQLSSYFPVFLAGFFSALVSLVATVILTANVYFQQSGGPERAGYIVVAIWLVAFLLSMSSLLILKGFSFAARVQQALLGICLVLGAWSLLRDFSFIALMSGVALPGCAMAICESRRYKEMIHVLFTIRTERVLPDRI